jgi:hypothetical protein
MRKAFAHEAILGMQPGADIRAPGAAITAALCGHWDHPPPCPLAPHHSGAERVGDQVRIRVLFAAEPDGEGTVRRRVEAALAEGRLRGPDGLTTRWRLLSSRPSDIAERERDHAQRLTRT